MFKSKLNTVISSLSAIQLNRLSKFIDSPYLNPNQSLNDFGQYIINHKDDEHSLDREVIWQNIFPESPFNYPKLRKMSSDLMTLIENFFVIEDVVNDPLEMKAKLTESLAKREMSILFSRSFKGAQKLDILEEGKTARDFYYKYQVEYNAFRMVNYDLDRFAKTNLTDITNNLDIFYVVEKLRYACDALSRNPLSKEYDDFLISEIVNGINKNEFLRNVPIVSVLLSIYHTLVDYENEEHYYNLKSLLEKYAGYFTKEDTKKFYESAINYVIDRINDPGSNFLNELFILYKSYLNKGFITIDDKINPYTFKNIVTTGLRLQEYEWVSYFIEEYKQYLPESFRDNVYSYHKAQLYFYTKDYGKMLQLLQTIEYEDLSYNLGAKSMLLAAYYETDEIEPLLSLLDSFKVFLNRQKKKIPSSTLNNYSNLLKFTRKLLRIDRGDKAAIEAIKNEMNATKGIASANWLKEKVDELE